MPRKFLTSKNLVTFETSWSKVDQTKPSQKLPSTGTRTTAIAAEPGSEREAASAPTKSSRRGGMGVSTGPTTPSSSALLPLKCSGVWQSLKRAASVSCTRLAQLQL